MRGKHSKAPIAFISLDTKLRPYWTKITVLFDPGRESVNKYLLQIQQANFTANMAARQINESLTKLSIVTVLRESVESTLGADFQSMYHNHSSKLEEIRRINGILLEFVSFAQNFGEKAYMNLTNATEIATQALRKSRQRRDEAKTALDSAASAHSNATMAKKEADTVLNTTMKFKVSIFS